MAMAGGTGPVNMAGLLVQTNAEILSGIVFTQLVRKSTPVIYSSYSTAMDLRLGTSLLGSPETALIGAAVAELCRYYQIPCLVPGIMSDSKQQGSQAAFEKTLTGVAAAMAGASLQVGIGGLETGLTFDFGQAVLDDEIVRMIRHLTRTLSQTRLFDRNNREDWEFNGKPDSYDRAMARAREILDTHEPEPLPFGAAERIRAIVEEAEKEIGIVTDKYQRLAV
jgi:trimethylamine--corrinoid protein Co-methyltransferase